MFTGLVEVLGQIAEVRPEPPGRRLVIEIPEFTDDCPIGASVAINGCCLTVVAVDGNRFEFQAGPETLSRTNLGLLVPGSPVNLERSLKFNDRLGGHLVTGHVDAIGTLDERIDQQAWSDCWFRVPSELTRQMASKGSVTVDGVSLTLVEVEDHRFSVALIPHTLQITTLGQRVVGDAVNIETDLLAKYVARQLSFDLSSSRPDASA